MNDFDVVIPIKDINIAYFPLVVESINKHIKPKNIICITASMQIPLALKPFENLQIIDENMIYPPLSKNLIKDKMQNLGESGNRASWYFQQFLKMAFALYGGGQKALSHLG